MIEYCNNVRNLTISEVVKFIRDTKHTDEVHNPEHYKLNGLNIEVVDVIRAVLTDEAFKGWCRGNALKYLMRAGKKDKSKEKQDFENEDTMHDCAATPRAYHKALKQQ